MFYHTVCRSVTFVRFEVSMRTFTTKSTLNKCVGPSSVENERFLRLLLRKYECPDENSVNNLQKKYPEPKNIIAELFEPLAQADKGREPVFASESKLNGWLWKATLYFSFPYKFHVTAVQSDLSKAREYAYLEACEMFKHLGFIDECDHKVISPQSLMDSLENLAPKALGPRVKQVKELYTLDTVNLVENNSNIWMTKICLKWPFYITVEAKANSFYSSQFEAALLVALQLKARRQKYNKTKLNNKILDALPTKEEFDPDCIFYVDASRSGFGAYLKMENEEGVRWLSEKWPQDMQNFAINNASFSELYALVCACYTWKHKFVNKRVLCYCDCQSTVCLINKNLYSTKTRFTKYQTLVNILIDTAQKYDIEFLACHVNRRSNSLADMLSRSSVDKFRERVPEAHKKSKKIKKLFFLGPLTTVKNPQTEIKKSM